MNQNPRMKNKRFTQICLAIAVSFLVLGIGNTIYGSVKLSQYSRLLKNANDEMVATEAQNAARTSSGPSRTLKLLTGLNLDQQEQHINKLRIRLDFYAFVARGGKCFLALSALAFLAFVLSSIKSGPSEEDLGA